ncbi:MAG: peptidylprolyl isomerase [Candidatus Kapabacteria bacterium]|jgi:peptidyl-prolyl cis-trans isomerase B (cyclophilin B)|nr:peptidylprolyl isomerase [Candidatus Kapabacteria bacterium]
MFRSLFLGLCFALFAIVMTPSTSTAGELPEYTITVTQGGKELGKIVLRLWTDVAPNHCKHFDDRVKEGYYNGTAFHRVIPGFMIQGGDPNSKDQPRETWGTGGHPTKVKAEFSKKSHVRGVLSAARTNDPNSYGGQFFICVGAPTFLDGQYTAFGEVVSGMEVADAVVNSPRDPKDNPLQKISMTIVRNESSSKK